MSYLINPPYSHCKNSDGTDIDDHFSSFLKTNDMRVNLLESSATIFDWGFLFAYQNFMNISKIYFSNVKCFGNEGTPISAV